MRRLLVIIVVILVIAGVAIALTNNKNKNKSTPTTTGVSTTQTNNQQQKSQNSNQTQSTNTDKVTISNFAFSPDRITIKKGTSVTWTNKDNVGHTVTENDSKSGPNSSTLQPGASYSFTFNEVGVYNYHCSLHPDMMGTVTVTD